MTTKKPPVFGAQPAPAQARTISTECLWTIQDLSRYSRVAVATIYSDLKRAAWRVPPPLPRRRRNGLRWDPAKAISWYQGEELPGATAAPTSLPKSILPIWATSPRSGMVECLCRMPGMSSPPFNTRTTAVGWWQSSGLSNG